MDERMYEAIREDIRDLRKDTTAVLVQHDERIRATERDSAVAKSWGRAAATVAATALAAVFARAAGVA